MWNSKTKIKKQEGGFLGILLGTLGASMLGNMLTGKVHPLSNIEITEYFNYEP